jgi:microcystin degradation protein MlrC
VKTRRIAIVSVYHESNTFADGETKRGDFRRLSRGKISEKLEGTQTVVGGFLQALREGGEKPVPTVAYWATPSSPVSVQAFNEICHDVRDSLSKATSLDAVLLELHGAMVTHGVGPSDGLVAEMVRKSVGAIPIVAVLDPHANLLPEITKSVDVTMCYSTNPHVDMADAGRTAVAVLRRLWSQGGRTFTAAVRIPIVAPAIAQGSEDEPLATLTTAATTLEQDARLVAARIFFGFAYADVPPLGMAAVASSLESSEHALLSANLLARECWAAREDFRRNLLSPADAFAQVRQGISTGITDTGDNIGGGASGRSTVLAREALNHPDLRVATTICDPAAVEMAALIGSGKTASFQLGHPPLEARFTVQSLHNGRFVNHGPLSAGVEFDMGPTAVLASGKLCIVVHSRPVMVNDQNLFRSVAVYPEEFDAILLKGAVAVRAGWRGVVDQFVDCDSPGVTPSSVRSLLYRNVSHPLWPLDNFCWHPSTPRA